MAVQLNNKIRNYLRANIVSNPHGALHDLWRQFLDEKLISAGSLPERQKEWLGTQGYTGPFGKRWSMWIRDLGRSYSAESLALFARFTTPPPFSRRPLIDNLIVSLKAAGVWTKLDAFYVLAVTDAQSAQRNWKEDAYNLTPTNSPVFTTDRGYACNGSSNYLATGFDPTTAVGGKFALNNMYMGLWALNLSANGRSGNDTARLGWGGPTSPYSRANDATTTTGGPILSSSRWMSAARTIAGSYSQRTNGVLFATVSVTSTAVTNAAFDIGQSNGSFGAGPYCAYAYGSYLTAVEDAALYAALRSYMIAVGAM